MELDYALALTLIYFECKRRPQAITLNHNNMDKQPAIRALNGDGVFKH